MKKKLIRNTVSQFKIQFHQEPDAVFLSPGRINIIGEHIDYNNGFVLPAAINKYVCFAVKKSSGTTIRLFAADLNDYYEFESNTKLQPIDKTWVNYLIGVIQELKNRELHFSGFDVVLSSSIPMGAGLSSSAAVSCGMAFALNELFDMGLTRETLARMGQKAEHEFAGVNCGIMDQFASVFGKKNQVIKLDCDDLSYQYYNAELDENCLLLIDSCVKHTHLTSGYNDRRQEVESSFAIIKQHFPDIQNFRDCTSEHLAVVAEELGAVRLKRCAFVIAEIARVGKAAEALNEKDFETLGSLMSETHRGLSTDYEVSCPELDFLVAEAQKNTAVFGARMMGGGFGGCSINLIKKAAVPDFINQLRTAYSREFGIELKYYPVKISKGTAKIKKTW
ncbi:galactokinase [Flavobacterium aurantiibacter]|uniref:Galactokinase n=1 Tax=Flavobacterium aurantiibacter TaxID=2023067 RepID=A0A255ZQN6_9FLAO|nr:galactokinase [Flavobacterium aurantiibacter]OYQ43766.1 galactokinase [Flavobacterium aurantiibacter]